VGPTCQYHLLPLILSHSAASATIDGKLQPRSSLALRAGRAAGELRRAGAAAGHSAWILGRSAARHGWPSRLSARRTRSSPDSRAPRRHPSHPRRSFPELLSAGADPFPELLPPTCPRRKTRRSESVLLPAFPPPASSHRPSPNSSRCSPPRPQAPPHRPTGLWRRTCESGSRRLACVVVASVLGWMLKKELTCGVHMSASRRRTIRNMCVQIRYDSGPHHLEDVENGKD
jgi:hypothetical protein